MAVGPKGDLYVSDGYGNCRVHRFSATGKLMRSWGGPAGPRPVLPAARHPGGADGRVFVCDRENDRIQIFSPDGEYLAEWTDTRRPRTSSSTPRAARTLRALVAPGQTSRARPDRRDAPGRVSIYDPTAARARALGHAGRTAAGSFAAPHGLAVNSSATST